MITIFKFCVKFLRFGKCYVLRPLGLQERVSEQIAVSEWAREGVTEGYNIVFVGPTPKTIYYIVFGVTL